MCDNSDKMRIPDFDIAILALQQCQNCYIEEIQSLKLAIDVAYEEARIKSAKHILEFQMKNSLLEDEVAKLNEEISELKRNSNNSKEKSQDIEENLLRNKNVSLTQELALANNKIMELERDNLNIKDLQETANDKIFELEREIDELKNKDLQDSANDKILELEKEIDELKYESLREMVGANNKIFELEREIGVLRKDKPNVVSPKNNNLKQTIGDGTNDQPVSSSKKSYVHINNRSYYVENISNGNPYTFLYLVYENNTRIIIPKIHKRDIPRFIKNVIDYCIENKCMYVKTMSDTLERFNFDKLKQNLQMNGKLTYTWEYEWSNSLLPIDTITKLKDNMGVVKSYVINYIMGGNVHGDPDHIQDIRLIFDVIKNMYFADIDNINLFRKKILNNLVTIESNPEAFDSIKCVRV